MKTVCLVAWSARGAGTNRIFFPACACARASQGWKWKWKWIILPSVNRESTGENYGKGFLLLWLFNCYGSSVQGASSKVTTVLTLRGETRKVRQPKYKIIVSHKHPSAACCYLLLLTPPAPFPLFFLSRLSQGPGRWSS